MRAYAGPPLASRSGEVTGTLWLLAYLLVSLALIVLDYRGGWLSHTRSEITAFIEPLRALAGLPGQAMQRVYDDAGTLTQLSAENRRLRNELLVQQARMARMNTVLADNTRLRAMFGMAQRGRLDVQLAPILDIDLDPTRQRLVLSAGTRDGVRVGQSVIDAGGLVGQITRVGPLQSDVLLLTDPDHAVPVAIARNGVRLVAYGTGQSSQLSLSSIPLSSDVKVGDLVVTSGLGGRFPPGFPVGTITELRPDESRAFLLGDLRPAAQLDRGRDVLLLRSAPERAVIGPGTQSLDLLGPTGATPPAAANAPVVTPGAVTTTATPATPSTSPADATNAPASTPAASPATTSGAAPPGTTAPRRDTVAPPVPSAGERR